MKRPPTVLQVLPRLVTGGVERGTVEVTTALVNAGWTAYVVSEGGPMVDEIRCAGGTHIPLPLASKNPFVMWANVRRLTDLIEEYKIDIIHARSRAPAWSAYFAAKYTSRPFVTTCHNAYGGKSWFKRLYNSIMTRGVRVVAISEFVADYVRATYRVPEDKLRVINRGVDTKRFDMTTLPVERIEKLRHAWHVTRERPIIMLPGRLTRWKGQRLFIEALSKLKHRRYHAIIVGSGDTNYLSELQAAITHFGLKDVVSIVGECDDMPAALAIATFVVSASQRPEGFGRVIVEAEAMGKPVIASNHGGASTTVIDGETGWLIPTNDVNALSNCLTNALSMSPERYQQMSEQAAHFARKLFSISQMTARTLDVYRELLGAS